MITTKVRFFLFFSRPRTSVVPVGLSEFGRRMGFIAVYRTADPQLLEQLHGFFVWNLAAGSFDEMLINAKRGIIALPPDHEHLRPCFAGFNA